MLLSLPARPFGARDSSRSAVIVRLRQIAFRSQAKIVLALAAPTALLLFLIFRLFWLAGEPVGGDDDSGFFDDFAVAAIFAAGILLVQLAALALLRVLPWPDPRLEIDGRSEEDRLSRVFE